MPPAEERAVPQFGIPDDHAPPFRFCEFTGPDQDRLSGPGNFDKIQMKALSRRLTNLMVKASADWEILALNDLKEETYTSGLEEPLYCFAVAREVARRSRTNS